LKINKEENKMEEIMLNLMELMGAKKTKHPKKEKPDYIMVGYNNLPDVKLGWREGEDILYFQALDENDVPIVEVPLPISIALMWQGNGYKDTVNDLARIKVNLHHTYKKKIKETV